MKKEMLLGMIMQRAGATGDTELISLLGELMCEVSNETEVVSISGKESGVYVLCVEATQADGKKVCHPVVGGGYGIPKSIEDYKMVTSDTLLEIQRQNEGMISAIKSSHSGLKTRIVNITDEAYESLKEKLKELLTALMTMIDEAAEKKAEAMGVMNIEVDIKDISDEMIREVMKKTLYAGACINDNGEVEERTTEKYVEENVKEVENDDEDDEDYEDDEDDEDDEESDGCSCHGCPGTSCYKCNE